MSQKIYREAKMVFPFIDINKTNLHGLAFKHEVSEEALKIIFSTDRSDDDQKLFEKILHTYADRQKMALAGFRMSPVLDKPLRTDFYFSTSGTLC